MTFDHLHVLPVGDTIAHEATEDCICGPTTRPVFRPDGSNGWISTHHSLDGREHREASE